MKPLCLAVCLMLAPAPAMALPPDCAGQDMIAALPDADRTTLEATANAVPFPQGNYWRATGDAQTATLLGTHHLDDPRNAATLAAVVEAGPAEKVQL